jgi:hypothetical protein
MIDLRFRPLDRWIREKTPDWKRIHGSFRAPYKDTLDLLESNLRHLRAKNATAEAAFREDQIRNDGWPYSNANPAHPGIILSLESKFGPLALPCDCFKGWQSNLRAIAFHLEHLRMATIYGVGAKGEQYKGWRQLPGPGGENSLNEFAERIVRMSGLSGHTAARVLSDYEVFRLLYRTAAKTAHPDSGGSQADWLSLDEAARILEQHFKGKTAAAR